MTKVHFQVAFIVGIFSFAISRVSNAAMLCEATQNSGFGSLLCNNTSVTANSYVLFRNMVPWNGHSGVTIIDVCSGKMASNLEPHRGCVRRYCTQNVDHLSMRFGPIIVPVSPVNVVIGFSFVHTFFEINCGNFQKTLQ